MLKWVGLGGIALAGVVAAVALAGTTATTTASNVIQCQTGRSEALLANRIAAKRQSYLADNPVEAAKVLGYMRGGARPIESEIVTHLGKSLLNEEDVCRGLEAASSTTTSTTSTIPDTTTTTTSPPEPGVDPSGEAAPKGDIPGWRQIFVDNFPATENVGYGASCGGSTGFPHNLTNWTAYPWPWPGTPTWANYCPERTTTIHDGMMDMFLHSETISGATKYLITANAPKIAGYPGGNGQLYGRYVIRYSEPLSFSHYHVSWLLWPLSETWPRDGEIDFPEADTNSSNISAFMHRQGGTSGGDQDGYSINVPIYGGWHTAVIEWSSTHCKFILDGRVVGDSTSRIPNTPMRYIIQNGGSFGGSANTSDQGHILVDWVAIYAPGA